MSAETEAGVAAALSVYGQALADFREGRCSKNDVDKAAAKLREAEEADRLSALDLELLPALEDYRDAVLAADAARVRFEAAKASLLQSGIGFQPDQRSVLLDHDALARLTPRSLTQMLARSLHVPESDVLTAMRGLAKITPAELRR